MIKFNLIKTNKLSTVSVAQKCRHLINHIQTEQYTNLGHFTHPPIFMEDKQTDET